MKKLFLYIILFSAISFTASSQKVGINTNEPLGVFHIDPLTNTKSINNTSETSDDIIIDAEGNVGIGTALPQAKLHVEGNAAFTGKDTVQSINANNIIVNGALRIGADTLTNFHSKLEIISNAPGTGLRFDNGTQKEDLTSTLDMVPILTKKDGSSNELIWRNLPAITELRSKELVTNRIIYRQSGSNVGVPVNITKEPMVLDEGYWLIFAGISTYFPTSNLTRSGWYVYLNLREVMNDPSTYPYDKSIVNVGAPSEKGGAGVAVPQLVYLLHVEGTKQYNVWASTILGSTNNSGTAYRTTSTYGNPYFYAIKLDYTNP